MREIKDVGIDGWLNDPTSVLSSRMKSVMDVINKHQNERVVVFTCFRSCLDNFTAQFQAKRPIMTLASSMTTTKRAAVLAEFSKSADGVLMLTYELGAEGLNLQSSHTILLVDLWWNAGKTEQSIARVLRQGQTSSIVNVYYFTSNTGIEQALFNKHEDKLDILNEIMSGPLKSYVRSMSVDAIIAIVENEKNVQQLTALLVR